MKVIVQRAKNASVRVEGETVGAIDKGLVLLVGFTLDDDASKLNWMVNKITNLRIYEDEEGKMNLSVKDIKGSILSISQFTLYGDVKKGFRPSFTKALNPNDATNLFDLFNQKLSEVIHTETGKFGELMEVDFINDGPVTIIVEK